MSKKIHQVSLTDQEHQELNGIWIRAVMHLVYSIAFGFFYWQIPASLMRR